MVSLAATHLCRHVGDPSRGDKTVAAAHIAEAGVLRAMAEYDRIGERTFFDKYGFAVKCAALCERLFI